MRPGETSVGSPAGGLLLERERELDSLDRLLDGLRSGQARLLLVEGAAGIGKSRLLGEARRRASDAGARVLSARGGEFEREFPFGVVRQLFEPVLVAGDARAGLLTGAAGAAGVVFEADGLEGDSGGDASFAVLHGLYWLTVNVSAERPLVLAIDDLHWCDHPSLRFLAYLVRRLEGLPVLVVCCVRPSEPGVDTTLVAELAADPLALLLSPGPLTEIAGAELVRERLGDEADARFVAACHAATGGNPLLLSELLKALAAEGVRPEASQIAMVRDLGPRAASRAVLLRLARLTADAVALARAVAVLGDGADLAHAAALSDVDEARAARATGELVHAEILRPESPLGFVHPLVAAAVHHDVTPGERSLMHARAARLLADAGAPAEQVAAQVLAMPPRGEAWAVDVLRAAAGSALRKGAAESATAYLERALAEPPSDEQRTQTVLELGLAEALTSGPAAAQHLGEAFDALSDPIARATVAQALAPTLLFTGAPERGVDVARRAAAELPAEATELRLALEAFEHAALLFAGGPEALHRLERYRTERADGLGGKALAALAALDWAYEPGPADACAELALHALSGGELIAADNGGVLPIAASIVLALADRDEALDVWDAAFAEAHRRGSLFAIGGLHLWHGFTLYRRGELVEAEQALETAYGDFEIWGFSSVAAVYGSSVLTRVLVERGDLDGARRALARAGEPEPASDAGRYWLNSRLELLVAEGRIEDALATADELERRWSHARNPAEGSWRSFRAQALDRAGFGADALASANEEVELARRWGAPWALGRSLRVLGVLERDEGVERLQEAVDVLHGTPARLEHAKALAALGAALRHARRPSDAREPLRLALELADVCGAAALTEHVRSELYASGARPRTTALKGVTALTTSERRVADLAAAGSTNREIAQALYVTPKTVEVHLSNAYRKLDIPSRRQLASALADA